MKMNHLKMSPKTLIFVFLITALATLFGEPEILNQETNKTPNGTQDKISYKGGWKRVATKVPMGNQVATMIFDYNSSGLLSRSGIVFEKGSQPITQTEMNALMEDFFSKMTNSKYNPSDFIYQPLIDRNTQIPAFCWVKKFRSGYIVLPFGSRSVWCITEEADKASKDKIIPPAEVN